MKYKKIGHILILNEDVENPQKFIEMNGEFKHIKTVAKLNGIHGIKREPKIEILAGDFKTETTHKENGCYFKLDVSKVMWSKGNTNERIRIANLITDSETIIDMFAGIGYFSIPLAYHSNPKKIYSIELNPNSYNYLKKNIELNNVSNIINPILGDSNKITPYIKDNLEKQGVDRILMGYVRTTHEFLGSAIYSLKPGGTLHYHETTPQKIKFTRPIERIKKAAGGRTFEVLNMIDIKKYSPGVNHVVLDVKFD